MGHAIVVAIGFLLEACTFTPNPPGHVTLDDSGIDVPADANSEGGTPVDSSTQVTLTEATSSVVATGHAIFCSGGTQMIRDNAWFRVFRLSDFGIASTFHISRILFASESTQGATAVTVRIYTYTGVIGGTMLDVAAMVQVASITGSVQNNANPQDLSTTLVAEIAASETFVVGVSNNDTFTGSGAMLTWFHAGANSAGQTARSYYASSTCGESMPTSQSNFDLVLSVEGSY